MTNSGYLEMGRKYSQFAVPLWLGHKHIRELERLTNNVDLPQEALLISTDLASRQTNPIR